MHGSHDLMYRKSGSVYLTGAEVIVVMQYRSTIIIYVHDDVRMFSIDDIGFMHLGIQARVHRTTTH